MHHAQPSRSADRPKPAGSELRRRAAPGLARRHNLCANRGRMALPGRRARSLHKEDRRLGNARSHAAKLTIAALIMAIQRQKSPQGLIHHSDRGSPQGSQCSPHDPIYESEVDLPRCELERRSSDHNGIFFEVPIMTRRTCMNCGGGCLHTFLDLGRQPNGNNFLYAGETAGEPFFPLSMMVCEDCWQVQIAEFPSPEFLFSNHPYITGVNVPVLRHFERLAPHVIGKLALKPNDLVIDIGCNDGTLLACFANHGMRILGVDPGERTGELARKRGITVFRQFWNSDTGKSLRQLGVRPEVITATAVFYHVPDLHDFMVGLSEIMGQNTCFVVQGVNLKDLIEKNEFDHFYHEHSCIHAVASVQRLFAQHRLRIQDVEFSEIHGGSFVLYVYREENPTPTSPAVAAAIAAEKAAGLDRRETYDAFARSIKKNMGEVLALLKRLKAEGKQVYALGAPVKGSTLLNFRGIGSELVSCATEVNEFKIGRVMPGTHIPVVDERLLAAQPDYYLVLSWNFVDYLREKYHKYLASGGRFIVPVPKALVVGPKD